MIVPKMALRPTLMATAFFLLLSASFNRASVCQPPDTPVRVEQKVNVNFYYEALCQSCRNYINAKLQRLVNERYFGSIVNLRLIPWGNARIVGGNFECQYGRDECRLNALHACAIRQWPDPKAHMDFIGCSSNLLADHWASCVATTDAVRQLEQCATGNIGRNLQLTMAEETKDLDPPLEYVPWVTVNNVPLRKDIDNIDKYVCDAYKGPNPPPACNQSVRNITGRGDNVSTKQPEMSKT